MTARPYRIITAPGWDALCAALALAFLTYVWRVQDLFEPLAAMKLLAIATVLVAGFFMMDREAQQQATFVLRNRTARFVMLFCAMGALSVPTSLWPGMSLDFVLKNLLPTVVLALLVASAIRSVGDARKLSAVLVVGAALYAVVILVRFDIGPDGRLGNLVNYDANDLGMLLVCTLPLAIFFVRHAPSVILRLVAAGIAVLFILTIIKTGSRGAFLGLVAVTLALLLTFKSVRAPARIGLVSAIAVLLIAGSSSGYWTSMQTILTPESDYNWIGNQEGGRMTVWSRGIGYMENRPLTGVGINAFPIAEGTISDLASRQSFGHGLKWSAAHNSFVEAGAELGVAGLFLFIGMLFTAWRSARRLARDARGTIGVDPTIAPLAEVYAVTIIGYAVAGFFLSQAYGPYLYVVVGIIIGLDIATRRG